MTPYKITLPTLANPVTGYFNGTPSEAKAHAEMLRKSYEERINMRLEDAKKFKEALSGVRITKWLEE